MNSLFEVPLRREASESRPAPQLDLASTMAPSDSRDTINSGIARGPVLDATWRQADALLAAHAVVVGRPNRQ